MNDIITRETIQAHLDGLTTMIAAFNANDPRTINVPGYPLMVSAVDYNTLRAQLAEAQRNAATPTPDAFHKALRLAQRESLDRTGSGVVNWDQADAVMSDEARHLVECYIAAIDAAKGEPS